jgi:hypothetical protein
LTVRKRWKLVIVVLALVAMLVASGSFYYLLISGSETSSPRTPVTSVSKTNLTNGVRFTFSAWETETIWDQVRVYVSEGLHVGSWKPSKDDFAGKGVDSRVLLRNITLGTKVIGCELHDLSSNGFVNQGDEFTIIGTHGLYLMTLVYEPTGGVVLQASFSIPVHD